MSTATVTEAKTRLDEAALRDDIQQLKADLTQVRADLRNLTRDAVEAARTGVYAARERVQAAVDAAVERGRDNVRSVEKRIEEHPLLSVGIALGVGVLIGSLLRR
jgi:ElaB/YqjD/DUF883 family membrane-anchored ribosome-binding protein